MEGIALERPPGREWASLGRFGAAHQRVHRYLPTSLHNEEHGGSQCRRPYPGDPLYVHQAVALQL